VKGTVITKVAGMIGVRLTEPASSTWPGEWPVEEGDTVIFEVEPDDVRIPPAGQAQTLPLIDGVVWKQVRDLKEDDEIPKVGVMRAVRAGVSKGGWTIINYEDAGGRLCDAWPSAAWVPVLKPVVYEQTRRTANSFIAHDWRESTQGCVIQDVEYGEVVELRDDQ
jgi:hypothetical protein